jgi:hypothetical protein
LRRARPIGGIRDVNAFDGVLVGERVRRAPLRGTVEWGFTAPDVLALLERARMVAAIVAVLGSPARRDR